VDDIGALHRHGAGLARKEVQMRRIVVLLCSLVLLVGVCVPSAAAATPGSATQVSGGWSWVNTGVTFEPQPDGSMLVSGTEAGTWTGSFRGTSRDVFQMTQTPPVDDPDHWGPGWGTLTAAFEGKVGVKTGTMVLYITFWWAADQPAYEGDWTILSSTGALRHVTGHGTWGSADGGATYGYTGRVYWK
jgi:hypothetical protein